MNKEPRILIAGAGNFGRETAGWLHMIGRPAFGFIDDIKPGAWARILDYVPEPGDEILVAVADPKGREQVVAVLREKQATFHSLYMMHRSPSSDIGGGCIWCPGSAVSASAHVGEFVHVNLNSTVGHDVVLGDYCTLSCHVDLMGHVEVGNRVFFGSGARVLPGVRVGDDCVIGAGAIVMADVRAGSTVYAMPARTL